MTGWGLNTVRTEGSHRKAVHASHRDPRGILFVRFLAIFFLTFPLQIHARITEYFKSGATRPLPYRRRQLIQLARMVQDNLVAIEDALLDDLGKQRQESTLTESGPIVQACITALENLEEWTKPEKPMVEAWRTSWDVTIFHVPKGVGLFIRLFQPILPRTPLTSI